MSAASTPSIAVIGASTWIHGGVNYGFGYGGAGYEGGRWDNGRFFYNRAVTNIGHVNITNVYEQKVTVREVNRASFNGGPDGMVAKPTPAELEAAKDKHLARPPTSSTMRASPAGPNPRSSRPTRANQP